MFLSDNCATIVYIAINQTLKDPGDMPFAETAAACGADYLITGNRKHFPGKIGRTRVVSPDEFIKAFRENLR